MPDKFDYHKNLLPIAQNDVDFLIKKDTSYGASWKKSGGRSAWFMAVRKIDRLLELMAPPEPPPGFNIWNITSTDGVSYLQKCYYSENIFGMIAEKPKGEDGSVLAEIRDLRRYLLLIEAEMVERGVVEKPTASSSFESAAVLNKKRDTRCEWAPGLPSYDEDDE